MDEPGSLLRWRVYLEKRRVVFRSLDVGFALMKKKLKTFSLSITNLGRTEPLRTSVFVRSLVTPFYILALYGVNSIRRYISHSSIDSNLSRSITSIHNYATLETFYD
jgi:hypothetical protein